MFLLKPLRLSYLSIILLLLASGCSTTRRSSSVANGPPVRRVFPQGPKAEGPGPCSTPVIAAEPKPAETVKKGSIKPSHFASKKGGRRAKSSSSHEKGVAEKKNRSQPPKPTAAREVPKKREIIVIDAGHGGKDAGTESAKNSYREKELTLLTAELVKGYLESLGYPIIMTRTSDVFIKLEDRAELANTTLATLFVSIHYNHSPNPEAEGIEIFYYKDEKSPKAKRILESRHLGEEVLSTLVKHTGANARGVKQANFAVIRETEMPAILIEAGFLSNALERDRIKDPEYMRFLAWGIARGIDSYLSKGLSKKKDRQLFPKQ